MKKYKVELTTIKTYVVDVKAKNEKEAEKKASKKWKDIVRLGTTHFHEVGDEETEIGLIYDVTDTDDPFNEDVL